MAVRWLLILAVAMLVVGWWFNEPPGDGGHRK